jgi:hypothetical protein
MPNFSATRVSWSLMQMIASLRHESSRSIQR